MSLQQETMTSMLVVRIISFIPPTVDKFNFVLNVVNHKIVAFKRDDRFWQHIGYTAIVSFPAEIFSQNGSVDI